MGSPRPFKCGLQSRRISPSRGSVPSVAGRWLRRHASRRGGYAAATPLVIAILTGATGPQAPRHRISSGPGFRCSRTFFRSRAVTRARANYAPAGYPGCQFIEKGAKRDSYSSGRGGNRCRCCRCGPPVTVADEPYPNCKSGSHLTRT